MSGIIGTSHSKSKIVGRSKDTAKAWINFIHTYVNTSTDMSGVRDSFNVSSHVEFGTGRYTINFMNNMPNNDYVVAGSHNANGDETTWGNGADLMIFAPTVGGFNMVTGVNNDYSESGYVCAVVFGD